MNEYNIITTLGTIIRVEFLVQVYKLNLLQVHTPDEGLGLRG